MDLICFPYAGASSGIYTAWKKYLDAGIHLYPIEYAGRGCRADEPFYQTVTQAVADIMPKLSDHLRENGYALFGHSMGGLILCECMDLIYQYHLPAPSHVFISGFTPPHLFRSNHLHELTEAEFAEAVFQLGGTPRGVLDSTSFRTCFLPAIWNDIKIMEQHSCHKPRIVWDCDLSVFCGEDDNVAKHLDQWSQYTTGSCDLHLFEGGHFYLSRQIPDLVQQIHRMLHV